MTDGSDGTVERTLFDYAERDEPGVEQLRSLKLGHRNVGYIGKDHNKKRRVYVSEREHGKHRYYGRDPRYDFPFEGEAYGLSMELFSKIVGHGARIVYIVETDTGDIFEYAFSQFVDGHPINVEEDGTAAHPERGYEKDPQKVVPVEDAMWVYEDAHPGYRRTVTGYD